MSVSTALSTFAIDVQEGLTASPKYLSSRYFYDKRGSELFEEIMRTEAYYPTRCEYEVFELHKDALLNKFSSKGPFNLVEFGAGDGLKTKILLQHFWDCEAEFSYCPIDISEDSLGRLVADLNQEWPQLPVKPLPGDYFDAFARLEGDSQRKVALFLGSNIGNFREAYAIKFLSRMREYLSKDDLLMIGFDLKKDPETILNAYDDPEGVTRDFNLNLLSRINRDLGANFEVDAFRHYPTYNPMTGETLSYLVSTKAQEVYLAATQSRISFGAWEPIFMELSQKYDPAMIKSLAEKTGFRVVDTLTDSRGWFADVIWQPV
ncbi:MAG: L-histidine N(alpha)-methyltransferase [Bacteroidota bacterium]